MAGTFYNIRVSRLNLHFSIILYKYEKATTKANKSLQLYHGVWTHPYRFKTFLIRRNRFIVLSMEGKTSPKVRKSEQSQGLPGRVPKMSGFQKLSINF